MTRESELERILGEIADPRAKSSELLRSYRADEFSELWQADPRLYRAFAKRLIARGHPTRGYELAREGLTAHPGDLRLRFLCALALARGGNISKAAEQVTALLCSQLDADLQLEVRSLGGRLFKDRYERAGSSVARRKMAAESARLYREAYDLSGAWFPGINAATMLLLAGDVAAAKRIAAQVVQQIESDATRADDYWLEATLGEAYLLLGRQGDALKHYRHAIAGTAGRIGDIASMRRNVVLLAARLDVGAVPALFNIGGVVVFSGHMIDHPDRSLTAPPRFPSNAALERKVAAAIAAELDAVNATVGFSSAASGSDILFAEQMLRRGAELHIVLPFAREDFYLTSVDFGIAHLAEWRARFDAVLERATQVHHATEEKYLGDDVLLDFGNKVMQGLAITRARELGVEPSAIAVAEPGASRFIGGTAHFVTRWKAGSRKAVVINLAELRKGSLGADRTGRSRRRAPRPTSVKSRAKRRLHAMLFADVKNFSKLSEEQAPSFFVTFLNSVAGVISSSKRPPVFANTWGDGLFLVFDDVVECADFAIRLLSRVEAIDWSKIGLPADTAVRIGLHTGPVYPRMDRIIGRLNFFGSHVNRTARIEPVTTPGCAFASDQFAALLALEPGHPFVCEYVGIEQLAKEYASCPLYRVVRR